MELDISWVKPARGSSPKAGVLGVRISTSTTNDRHGKPRTQTTVRLGVDVMKKCGFLLGDKVAFGFAEMSGDRVMVVRRVNDGSGYALSHSEIKEYRGTNKTWGVAKMTAIDVPQGHVSLSQCIIHDDMLIVPTGKLE